MSCSRRRPTISTDEQSEIRVAVLASLCRALAYVGEDEQASVVRAEAAELARETGAREGLALVQTRSYWARGSLSLVEVLEALGEARDLGEELGDIDVRADAMGWRVVTLAALGELEAARRELAVALEASAQAGSPSTSTSASSSGRRWRSATGAWRRPSGWPSGLGSGGALARP